MKWNGREYRPPGYGIRIYPPKQDSIKELLKPLGEKERKGNVWIPVLNQPINVLKESGTPTPPTSPSPTPTKTATPTPTPSSSAIPASPSPTPTQTGTPTPTPSSALPTETFVGRLGSTTASSTTTFSSTNWGGAGLVVLVISQYSSGGNNNINSVTLAGSNMTQAPSTFREFQFGAAFWHTAIYYLDTALSSGDITINTSINVNNTQVGLYRLNNLTSTTPVYSDSSYIASTSSISLTTSSIANSSLGIGGVAFRDPGTCGSTYTNWTLDYGLDGNNMTSSSGSFTKSGVGTQNVSVSQACGNLQMMINLAVWR